MAVDKAPWAPRGHLEGDIWPKWRYDPDTGKGQVFSKAEDVPEGWVDAAEQTKLRDAPEAPKKVVTQRLSATPKATVKASTSPWPPAEKN